jgi:tripartite ATP-independent transporter DctP family solute receptor
VTLLTLQFFGRKFEGTAVVEGWEKIRFSRLYLVLQLPKNLLKSRGKMMLKKFRCLALVMALILVVVSCTAFAAGKKPIKLVYGSVYPADHYYTKADNYFKELVEKNSKGQITIDVFPASQLGNFTEQWQAVKSGAQQMHFGGLPTNFCPKLQTFELPYLFRDEKHILKVSQQLTSLIDEDELAAKAGMRIMGVRQSSARHLTTKIPVNRLEDIKGLKIRVPENGLYLAMWRALGAIPTCIPITDTYTALATGTLDAEENPFGDIYTRKFYEQTKYCALTSHVLFFRVMLINNNFWKKLKKSQQKIIADAADKSCKMADSMKKEDEKNMKNLLTKGGMIFTTPNTAPFREKAKTIWKEFGDPELISKIEAIK